MHIQIIGAQFGRKLCQTIPYMDDRGTTWKNAGQGIRYTDNMDTVWKRDKTHKGDTHIAWKRFCMVKCLVKW